MLKKYPRTYHLPWSLGRSSDDKVLSNVDSFIGQEVVITEKMDGENSSLYPDGKTHARSLDSANHVSRDWLKSFWASRCYLLASGLRICGENLYARHSLAYDNLPSYFMGFSVWAGETCLSWDDAVACFRDLDIIPVSVLYRGIFDARLVESMPIKEGTEGYVVRLAGSFAYSAFSTSVAKCVRANHIQTDKHWMLSAVQRNGLADGSL